MLDVKAAPVFFAVEMLRVVESYSADFEARIVTWNTWALLKEHRESPRELIVVPLSCHLIAAQT